MSITTRRTDLSRRTFILTGAAGALAARSTLSLAHAQPAAGNINFRVTGTQSPSVIFVHGSDWLYLLLLILLRTWLTLYFRRRRVSMI